MNNLPTTLDGLLELLQQFVTEATDDVLGTYDPEMIGAKVSALLDQYEAQHKEK